MKIIEMVNGSKFKEQLQAILLDGIVFGGVNVVNIEAIAKAIGISVITVTQRQPDFVAIKETLRNFGMGKKYKLMEIAGMPEKVELKKKKSVVLIQHKGCSLLEAKEIIRITTTHSFIPEPIRAAHLIGQGIVGGES